MPRSNRAAPTAQTCTVVIPCYDDSESLSLLIPQIMATERPADVRLEILIVNDTAYPDRRLEAICTEHRARLLTVPFNMGHQEAIVYGLRSCLLSLGAAPAAGSAPDRVFLTMDADGQDDPAAIGRLLEAVRPGEVVVAQRVGKRPEGLVFSTLYSLHKKLFQLLVGFPPDYGNFAAFDARVARHIALSPMFDIAYSLSLPLIAPIRRVPVERQPRLVGSSKGGFASLFDHALKLLLPHWQAITRRVAIASLIIGGASMGVAFVASLLRLFAPAYAFPNWATTIAFGALIVCLQLLTLCAVLFLSGSISRQVSVSASWRHSFDVEGSARQDHDPPS